MITLRDWDDVWGLGLTASDFLFKCLRDRELCADRPSSVRIGRRLFEYAQKELAAQSSVFTFETDRFTLWGVPMTLDWTIGENEAHFEVTR